jgi:hypothetical protein
MSRHEGPIEGPIVVVGLQNCGNGRSCRSHRICGEEVQVGMLLRFLVTIVKMGDGMQYAIGAYRVDAGVTTCLVGFLPAGMVAEWQQFEDRLGQVTEVKKNSSSYGSCDVIILQNETSLRNLTSLPDIGTTVVDENDDRARTFYGNKGAVAWLIKSMKSKKIKEQNLTINL